MTRPTLSVILITKNEAELVGQCLESVKWADEIVVVDSGSQDATVEICRRYTDKVVVTDWPGFGPQKNRALAMATGDWVLSIDADEQVTPELAEEIRNTIKNTDQQVFRLPRLSSFMGRYIRHGDWWPDEIVRLFRREHGRFSDDLVHERLMHQQPAGRLQHLMLHQSTRSIEQLIGKINAYTTGGAARVQVAGKPAGIGKAITHALWAFVWGYIFKRGFLDGKEGFIIAVSVAENSFYKYVKAGYLPTPQTEPSSGETRSSRP